MTVPQNPPNARLNPTPDAGPDDPAALNARSDGLAEPGSVPAAASTTLPVDVVDDPHHNRAASNSLRPPYGRSQAQAPAEGGGGDPARAPGLGVVAAEGSRDQDQPSDATQHADTATPPRVVRATTAAAARRKPKRRTRNAEQKKKSRVTVRFDAAEKQRLKAEAKAGGLTMANLIARRTLGTDTTPTIGSSSSPAAGVATRSEQLDAAIDELAATRTELGAWGNNLNQVARQLNMGGILPPGPAADFAHAAVVLLPQVRALVAELDERANRLAKLRGGS